MSFEIPFFIWIALGLLLLAIETVAPTTLFLWTGIGALATGMVSLILPLPWPWEVAIFSLLSLAGFFAYRRWKPNVKPSDQPNLNRRGASLIGRQLTLSNPIVNGVSRAQLDDSQWRISGPDLPAGTTVVVTAVTGATLRIERAFSSN